MKPYGCENKKGNALTERELRKIPKSERWNEDVLKPKSRKRMKQDLRININNKI